MSLSGHRFSREVFGGSRLFVATPVKDGVCTTGYFLGMSELAAACAAYEITLEWFRVEDGSSLPEARNRCAEAFLASEARHLLFIDADIAFQAKEALSLFYLALLDREQVYDIQGGAYPEKTLSFWGVKHALSRGISEELDRYTGKYVLQPVAKEAFSYRIPFEVTHLGTGFTLITKNGFRRFRKAYPEREYRDSEGVRRFAFFSCEIDPETRILLSEDYSFCQRIRRAGGKIRLVPDLDLGHEGFFSFRGHLRYLSEFGNSFL